MPNLSGCEILSSLMDDYRQSVHDLEAMSLRLVKATQSVDEAEAFDRAWDAVASAKAECKRLRLALKEHAVSHLCIATP